MWDISSQNDAKEINGFILSTELIVLIIVNLLSQHYFSVECNVQNES